MKESQQYSLFDGRRLRDEGVEQVVDNHLDWHHSAMLVAYRLRSIGRPSYEFVAEDLREPIINEIGGPEHPNSWGALTINLIREGMLKKTGEYRQMKLKSSHARVNPVYRWAHGTAD